MAHCNFFCFSQVSSDHSIYYDFCNLLVDLPIILNYQTKTSLRRDGSLTYFASLYGTKHNTLLRQGTERLQMFSEHLLCIRYC